MEQIHFSNAALESTNGSNTRELARVRAGWTWLLFGIATAIFAAATWWAFYATVADTVSGAGIMLRTGGVFPASARHEGLITQLNVTAGSRVTAEQVICQIHQPKDFFQLVALEQELKILRDDLRTATPANRPALERTIADKVAELDIARRIFRETFWLPAGTDGVVIELLKSDGDYVMAGERVALIAADLNQGVYISGYIPASSGKRVRPGMVMYFDPYAVNSAEYGFMQAVVRDVSASPVNVETIAAELQNHSLAESLSGGNAMVHVTAELIPDASTYSKVKWTSADGAPISVSGGLMGDIIIKTEYRSPASFMLPMVHSALHREN